MFILLPLTVLILCARLWHRRFHDSMALSLVIAAIVVDAGLIAGTEILSAGQWLTAPNVRIMWAAAFLFCLGANAPYPWTWASWTKKIFSLPVELRWVLGVFAFTFLMPLAITAFFAPPNTWDSMTYHLPRVEHWIQNKTLAIYPTAIDRQIWKAPGAEILALHVRLLSGHDRWVNMLQWLAFLGSGICAWVVMGGWKLSAHARILAVVMVGTIPMAILQATSSQNDLLAGFWLLAMITVALVFLAQGSRRFLILTALAVALAVNTKETNYVFVSGFCFWMAVVMWRQGGWTKAFSMTGVLLAAVAVVNAGVYARNVVYNGHLIGGSDYRLVNESFQVSVPVLNGIRYVFGNLSSPLIPLNQIFEHVARSLALSLHLNIDDLRTAVDRFSLVTMVTDEDYAPNLIIGMLIGVSVLILCWRWVRKKDEVFPFGFVAAFCLSALAFCWYLKWQAFNNRIMLPLLLWGALIAASFWGRRLTPKGVVIMAGLLMLTAWPNVVFNATRPLLGPAHIFAVDRQSQMYRKQPDVMTTDFMALALSQRLSCQQVGLVIGTNDWEYPLWAALRLKATAGFRLEHILTDGSHAAYPLGPFVPCMLVSTTGIKQEQMILQGELYRKVFSRSTQNGPEHAVWVRQML